MDNRIKNSNYYNNLTNLDNLNMILNFNNEFTTRKNIYIKDKIFDDFNKNNQRNSYNSDFDKLQNDINDLNNKINKLNMKMKRPKVNSNKNNMNNVNYVYNNININHKNINKNIANYDAFNSPKKEFPYKYKPVHERKIKPVHERKMQNMNMNININDNNLNRNVDPRYYNEPNLTLKNNNARNIFHLSNNDKNIQINNNRYNNNNININNKGFPVNSKRNEYNMNFYPKMNHAFNRIQNYKINNNLRSSDSKINKSIVILILILEINISIVIKIKIIEEIIIIS